MKNCILILLFAVIACTGRAQIHEFDSQAMRMNPGDSVLANKAAVILDSASYERIRINLKQYAVLKDNYEANLITNKKLVNQLNKTKDRLNKLLNNSNLQGSDLSALNHLVTELGSLSTEMGEVNKSLDSNNRDFSDTINDLESTNSELNKQITQLKFKNLKNYILAGLTGVAIGTFIGLSI